MARCEGAQLYIRSDIPKANYSIFDSELSKSLLNKVLKAICVVKGFDVPLRNILRIVILHYEVNLTTNSPLKLPRKSTTL